MIWTVVAMVLAGAQATPADEKGDPVIMVAPDDPAMEAAKREGRRTLPDFYRHFAKPGPGEGSFSVKFDLLPGPAAEFIWATLVSAPDKSKPAIGILGNAPQAPGFALGQRVEIREADIIDWQYRKDRRMEGHYTTRVLIDRMPAEEAREFRAALGW